MKLTITGFLACTFAMLPASALFAGTLTVQVSDDAGAPLEDAVVYAEAVGAPARSKPASAEIEQKGRKFLPLVTVVQTGAAISFPNHDTVRHHVYSFSQAKNFELKLYSGMPSAPVVFDKPGTVVIGCNIHDRMIAYVQVVDTPYFGKTDAAGTVRITGIPDGHYVLRAWHYRLPPNAAPAQQPLSLSGDAKTAFRLGLAPQ